MKEGYVLTKMPYEYNALEPYISEEQLKIHHTKHHQAYVNGANAVFEKLKDARKKGVDLDMKAVLKHLAFNVGGHILHSLFWRNLCPVKESGKPDAKLMAAIKREFGSFERFKKEFNATASSIEGGGWAALALCKKTGKLLIMQVEKHQVNIYPMFKLLLMLDMWEHAFYLDYKNEKVKFIDGFWNIVNWKEVGRRFSK